PGPSEVGVGGGSKTGPSGGEAGGSFPPGSTNNLFAITQPTMATTAPPTMYPMTLRWESEPGSFGPPGPGLCPRPRGGPQTLVRHCACAASATTAATMMTASSTRMSVALIISQPCTTPGDS